MKISIVGYGKMGQLVDEAAKERNVEIASIVDPSHPQASHKQIDESAFENVDVCICFTEPSVALQNIFDACALKTDIVMATTGWTDQMNDVRQKVEEAGIGMVYSSNFSIGVNIFFHLIQKSAEIFNKFEMYDVAGFEVHHTRKKDSPSGTAETIANMLVENIDRKTVIARDRINRKPEPEELHFASLRVGDTPGTHAVSYDSDFDTIELKHTARNRKGFAVGSITAANWIHGKKGLFTEKDMMNQLLNTV